MEIAADVGQPVSWISESLPPDAAGAAADDSWANFDGSAPEATKSAEEEAGWADFTTFSWSASQGNGLVLYFTAFQTSSARDAMTELQDVLIRAMLSWQNFCAHVTLHYSLRR